MPRRPCQLFCPPAASALAALLLLGAGCKREEPTSAAERALAPYLKWCDAQGAARNSCLVSAARVTGDAAACSKVKGAGPERTACLVAAAVASGQSLPCRALADRELVQCALSVAAETGHASACDVLQNVHWQGGSTQALCAAVARGELAGCPRLDGGGELASWCLRYVALRRRDASACAQLGKDTAEVQRCGAAVAVARHAPLECAAAYASSPAGPAQHRCEVEAQVALGRFPPCFSDPALCERFLWVPRPCEGVPAAWADSCLMHQAVFSTGPFGCGAVADSKRRALCAQLRDAQEGYLLRAKGADAGPASPPGR
ncbi:MAG: hypothetical protein ACLPJH_12020 [Myxococcaceae bacterium]